MLHAPILQTRHQAAAFTYALAPLVEPGIHHILVKDPAYPGQPNDDARPKPHQPGPNGAVKPITRTREPPVKPDHRPLISFLNIIFAAQKSENFRLGMLENIFIRARKRAAPIKPPTEAETENDRDRGSGHDGKNAEFEQFREIVFDGPAFEKTLEPGPGGRPEKSEHDREESQNEQRDNHRWRALVRLAAQLDLWVLFYRRARMLERDLLGNGGFAEPEPAFPGEDEKHLPRHVERGQQRAENAQIERKMRGAAR